MGFIEGDVAVKQVDARNWQLVNRIVYQGRDRSFTVPVGFQTDFASVPRPFVWLIPRYGLYTKSAILHDYLCQTLPVSRRDADGLFRRSMHELGVAVVRRWMMWAAVRLGGRMSGAGIAGFLLWLLVALPSLAFVFLPAAVVLIWLAAFWLVEMFFYLALRPFRRAVRRPRLLVRMS